MAVRPAQIWLPQAMINDPSYPQRLRRFFFFLSFRTSFVSFPLAPENIVYTVCPDKYSQQNNFYNVNKIFSIYIEKNIITKILYKSFVSLSHIHNIVQLVKISDLSSHFF